MQVVPTTGNFSRWGKTYVPNWNALGIESAVRLIYVQQSDLETRIGRGVDGMDTLVG